MPPNAPPGARPGMPPNAPPGARPGMPPNAPPGARPGMPNATAPDTNNMLQLHPSAASGSRAPVALQPSLRQGPPPIKSGEVGLMGQGRPIPHLLPDVPDSSDGTTPRLDAHGMKPGSPPTMLMQRPSVSPTMQPGRPLASSSPFGRPPPGSLSPSAARFPNGPSQRPLHPSGSGLTPPKPGQMMNVSPRGTTDQPHPGVPVMQSRAAELPRLMSPPPFPMPHRPNRPPVHQAMMPPGDRPPVPPGRPPEVIPPPRSFPAHVNQPSLVPSGPTTQSQSLPSGVMVPPPMMNPPDRPPFATSAHATPPKAPAMASGVSTPDSSSSRILEFKDAESDSLNFGSATPAENAASLGEDGDKPIRKKWLGFL